MTDEFKSTMSTIFAVLGLILLSSIVFILYIPTLGHIVKVFNIYWHTLVKWKPNTFEDY